MGVAYRQDYPLQWEKMVTDHPEILQMSSNKYQNWETTDPKCWVPHRFRRDSQRGARGAVGLDAPSAVAMRV
jgi:hypothetical protein